jgi:hypothetical protein
MDARCEGRLRNRKSESVRDNWQQRRLHRPMNLTPGDKTVTRRLCVGDIQEIAIVYEYIRRPTSYNLPEGTATQKFRQLNTTFQLVTGKVL